MDVLPTPGDPKTTTLKGIGFSEVDDALLEAMDEAADVAKEQGFDQTSLHLLL